VSPGPTRLCVGLKGLRKVAAGDRCALDTSKKKSATKSKSRDKRPGVFFHLDPADLGRLDALCERLDVGRGALVRLCIEVLEVGLKSGQIKTERSVSLRLLAQHKPRTAE